MKYNSEVYIEGEKFFINEEGEITLEKEVAKCSFCHETNCPASCSAHFPTIDKTLYVDFRADMEFNQIDCQFGILGEDGKSEWGEWSDCAIDINFCPVCGRRLEKTSFME